MNEMLKILKILKKGWWLITNQSFPVFKQLDMQL